MRRARLMATFVETCPFLLGRDSRGKLVCVIKPGYAARIFVELPKPFVSPCWRMITTRGR